MDQPICCVQNQGVAGSNCTKHSAKFMCHEIKKTKNRVINRKREALPFKADGNWSWNGQITH